MISNNLTNDQRNLLAEHESQGVIDVRRLPVGTLVAIDTATENFELLVCNPDRGVVLVASNRLFPKREKAVVVGSLHPETRLQLPRIIGKDLRIILKINRNGKMATPPVLAARVTGRNASFEYDMWSDE